MLDQVILKNVLYLKKNILFSTHFKSFGFIDYKLMISHVVDQVPIVQTFAKDSYKILGVTKK